jgi:D-alanyl-D-alanine dipeptidase
MADVFSPRNTNKSLVVKKVSYSNVIQEMKEEKMELVNVADYGLEGVNYYWTRRERFGFTEKELISVGMSNGSAYVLKELIGPLKRVNKKLEAKGYRLAIKDAYRSKEAYELIFKRLCEKKGEEFTSTLLSLERMPHSTGRAVDVALVETKTNKEVWLRNGERDDMKGGRTYGFYKNKADLTEKRYHDLQTLLVEAMFSEGFSFGNKKEFWHFEYKNN